MREECILDIRGLKAYFFLREGIVRAVDAVDFQLKRGEALGLIGESGSGKTVTGLSILRLLRKPGKIAGGNVLFEGDDLLTYSEKRMRKQVRGTKVSMIFQDPMTSLNPVFTVGSQLAEAIRIHQINKRSEVRQRCIELMGMVGIPSAASRLLDYPHQFSGGMRQRLMIAIAISCYPSLIIADEPTTALDVTIQAQVLSLMRDIIRNFGSSLLLISHDLGVIAQVVDTVAVMYAGRIVEYCDAGLFFEKAKHPYSLGLLNCFPEAVERKTRLKPIAGTVPNLLALPVGCRFSPRCPEALSVCLEKEPELEDSGNGHSVRCWLHSGRRA